MDSALKLLFDSEIGDRVAGFLRGRGERARIVAPRWVRQSVLSGSDQDFVPRATWAEDAAEPELQGEAPGNFIVLAEDAARERAIIQSLSLGPGRRAFGLFRHIVPALICHMDGLARPSSAGSLKRYAILCVPRSGSRYLTTTLCRAGVGAPLEHLRPPLAIISTAGKLGFPSAMKAVEEYGQANGIFGTKLVSTFLLEASAGRISNLDKNVEWLAKRGYRFVYLERPLIDSVVSSYVAVHLKKWHFFGPLADTDRQRLQRAPFSENQIWGEYIRFKADKAIMNRLVAKHEMATFQYGDVCDRTDRITGWICDQLSVDPVQLKPVASIQIPVATRSQSSIYEEFTDRLEQLLERRKGELDSVVVACISEKTGLQQAAAQKMLREYEGSVAVPA